MFLALRARRRYTVLLAATAVGLALSATVPSTARARSDAGGSAAPHLERISVAADGTTANDQSYFASTTPQGGHSGFLSHASNLAPGDQPSGLGHVKDLRTGKVTRIADSLGAPVVSDDGRFAAYTAKGAQRNNVFLADLSTGERRLIGGGAEASATDPTISADGRYVAYRWRPVQSDGTDRIEVYDRVTDTRETIADGPPGFRDLVDPSISSDGLRVAYHDQGSGMVWVRDRATGSLLRADHATPGTRLAELSGNGRFVVMNTPDGKTAIRDLQTGWLTQLAKATGYAISAEGNYLLYADRTRNILRLRHLPSDTDHDIGPGTAGSGAVSAGGYHVVFSSEDGLTPGDTNGVSDIYRWTAR